MKNILLLPAALLATLPLCALQAAPKPRHHAPAPAHVYVARLLPLNSNITGHKASGELRIVERGNTLTIDLHAAGLPPSMMHMVHLHGFVDGQAATCPTSAADDNHDGIIDLHETEAVSGTTMVPFTADPASLQIATSTYPKASATGHLVYRTTVSLSALDKAMAAHFQGARLDLAHRVVYIHGIPAAAKLPTTVASLPGVPAQATLPIACGQLVPVK